MTICQFTRMMNHSGEEVAKECLLLHTLNSKINSFPLKIVIYIKPALLRNERLYWPEFEIFGIFGYVLRLARAET